MALHWMDSMMGYVLSHPGMSYSDINCYSAAGYAVEDTTPQPISGVYRLAAGGSSVMVKHSFDSLIPTGTSVIWGGWFSYGSESPNHPVFMSLGIGNTYHFNLGCFAGELLLRLGSTGSPVVDTSPVFIKTDTWYHIEAKVNVNATTGSYEIRLNGETIMSDTNVDTVNGSDDNVDFVHISPGFPMTGWMGPWWVLDSTGSQMNDFIGPAIVEGMSPTSDGTRNDFTASAGLTNYENVDDGNSITGTSDYVSGSVVGDDELYGHPAISLGSTVDTVYAVGSKWFCEKTEPGTRTMRGLIRSSATESEAARISPVTSRRILSGFWSLNPNGSVAWTEATANAAEVGYTIEA